jgi:hypothetical protein
MNYGSRILDTDYIFIVLSTAFDMWLYLLTLQPIHHQKIHWRSVDGLANRFVMHNCSLSVKSYSLLEFVNAADM